MLLVYRISAALYCATTLLLIEFNGDGLELCLLKYFTNWTFILLTLYSVIGVLLCIGRLTTTSYDGETSRPYSFLDKAFVIVSVTTSSCAVFLTGFYWLVLYVESDGMRADNVMRHGGNVVVIWLEYLLSRTPVCGYWIQPVVLYMTAYAVFLWVHAGVGSGWVYSAMDFNEPRAVCYYLALPIFVLFGFVLTCALQLFRFSRYIG